MSDSDWHTMEIHAMITGLYYLHLPAWV
ncbi:hypothetical protein CARN8_1120006 [mine drainage metagenome]|uniref:Uncharacterized protein n=1 Tax=mine drainage metagenome TaxID=410659 RepID=A0A3P3ZLB4_9ZZZZ